MLKNRSIYLFHRRNRLRDAFVRHLDQSVKVSCVHFASSPSHVIGSSDLVDLWVSNKNQSVWSFARVVRRDHVNRARHADHAARACDRFAYSIVKVTRLCDYQTWQTRFILFFEKFTSCAKVCEFFSWLCFLDADWLSRQTDTRPSNKKYLFAALELGC